MGKKESTGKTEKNSTEPPVEEPKTEVEKMEAIKDWQDYKGHIKHSPTERKWYCFDCKEIFTNGNQAAKHAIDVHGFPNKPDTPEDENIPEVVSKKGLTALEVRKLLTGGMGTAAGLIDPADLALEINAEEEAKHIRELIKNPYVLYMFSKMKDERIIYPDWNIADALREGFLVLADKLGCYASFGQDMEKLKQDPHWSNVAIKIAEAWERQDAEEAAEKAKPKQTIAVEAKS